MKYVVNLLPNTCIYKNKHLSSYYMPTWDIFKFAFRFVHVIVYLCEWFKRDIGEIFNELLEPLLVRDTTKIQLALEGLVFYKNPLLHV